MNRVFLLNHRPSYAAPGGCEPLNEEEDDEAADYFVATDDVDFHWKLHDAELLVQVQANHRRVQVRQLVEAFVSPSTL